MTIDASTRLSAVVTLCGLAILLSQVLTEYRGKILLPEAVTAGESPFGLIVPFRQVNKASPTDAQPADWVTDEAAEVLYQESLYARGETPVVVAGVMGIAVPVAMVAIAVFLSVIAAGGARQRVEHRDV